MPGIYPEPTRCRAATAAVLSLFPTDSILFAGADMPCDLQVAAGRCQGERRMVGGVATAHWQPLPLFSISVGGLTARGNGGSHRIVGGRSRPGPSVLFFSPTCPCKLPGTPVPGREAGLPWRLEGVGGVSWTCCTNWTRGGSCRRREGVSAMDPPPNSVSTLPLLPHRQLLLDATHPPRYPPNYLPLFAW